MENKNRLYMILSGIIIVVVYHILIILFIDDRNGMFWTIYIFTMIAFIIQGFIVTVFTKGGKQWKDSYINLSIGVYCAVYMLVQLIGGIVLMNLKISLKVTILIEIFTLAGFLMLFLFILFGKEHIDARTEDIKVKTEVICELVEEIALIKSRNQNFHVSKRLDTLEQIVRYSDPMSSNQLKFLENQILIKISELKQTINGETEETIKIIDEIILLCEERNRKCLLMKY